MSPTEEELIQAERSEALSKSNSRELLAHGLALEIDSDVDQGDLEENIVGFDQDQKVDLSEQSVFILQF